MQVECPSCQTDNQIEYSENIVCFSCKESFKDHAFKKFKKPLISTTTALIIGIYGTYKIDNTFFEEQRLPIQVEYELIDSCVNSSGGSLRSSQYVVKKEVCMCALEQTVLKINYEEMKKNESLFMARFNSNISICY
ncbi:hypothetical protein [uncultured Shewanella sp.]|uniref:hypothetical protein n=1 Tax=uncultured Shewanella sp. TaxID=173975 RepID=UPI0026323A70|nr:hypothetical protein [uncultured Shewanella sp.]